MGKLKFFAASFCTAAFGILFSVNAIAEEATTTESGAGDSTSGSAGFSGMLPFIIMIAVFGIFAYFLIIRPDKKRRKEADELRSGLKVGDNVTTIGGIIGTVTSVSKETFTLNNGLKLKKTAILSIDDRDIDLDDEDEDDEDEDENEKENNKKI